MKNLMKISWDPSPMILDIIRNKRKYRELIISNQIMKTMLLGNRNISQMTKINDFIKSY